MILCRSWVLPEHAAALVSSRTGGLGVICCCSSCGEGSRVIRCVEGC